MRRSLRAFEAIGAEVVRVRAKRRAMAAELELARHASAHRGGAFQEHGGSRYSAYPLQGRRPGDGGSRGGTGPDELQPARGGT